MLRKQASQPSIINPSNHKRDLSGGSIRSNSNLAVDKNNYLFHFCSLAEPRKEEGGTIIF